MAFVALIAAWIFCGSAAAAVAPPIISDSEILTPDEIRPGMTGYGLTVFEGNKIERFNVSVIGVLRGWEFDADVILIRITSGPVVTRKWGIISGMSGSPIYINGKLVGALALGWTFSTEPIAGVTPIRQMVENYSPGSLVPGRRASLSSPTHALAGATLLPEGAPLKIGGRLIQRARISYQTQSDTASSDANTMMLTPVATPVMVNGLGSSAIAALAGVLEPYGLVPTAGGGKAPMRLTATPRPGDAIGVQLVGGDIDLTAVGTVTYVKNGRVLAMGHPFLGTGAIDLPMVNAYIHGILPSQNFSFKIASSGNAIIGRWTEDRTWSLGGVLGEKPQTFPASFEMIDKSRGVHKKYSALFGRHRMLTPVLAAISVESAVTSIAPSGEGTLRTELEIDAKGLPALKRQNCYSRPTGGAGGILSMLLGGGGADSPGMELYSLLDTLENNSFGAVPAERVSLRAEWVSERLAATIEEVRSRKSRVRPGDKIEIEIIIQPWGKPKETRVVEVEVPRNVSPGRLQVGIGGGLDALMLKARIQAFDPSPIDFAQQWEILAKQEKNDDLLVEMALGTVGVELKGRQLLHLPYVVTEVVKSANISGGRVIRDHQGRRMNVPYVLSGVEVLTFIVETDEKEKSGRGPAAEAPAAGPPVPSGMLKELFETEGEMSSQARFLQLEDEGLGEEGEEAEEESPPEMPSWDEVEELESQEPEPAPAEEPGKKPKEKGVLRGPQIWRQTESKDFAQGKTFGTAVNTSGQVDLAPAAKSLYEAQEGLLWAQASDGEGNLYVGSWMSGKVIKISPEGTASVVLESSDIAILALAVDPAGIVYAAAAPSGIIYRITPEGKSSEFCKLPAPYVWALLIDGEKGLLAATGPEGELFCISSEGKAELVFQAPDRHVIALAAAPEGILFAATYPKGKVYRIRDGKIEPFYETVAGVTALSLAVDSKGNLFVGTSAVGRIIQIDSQARPRLFYESKERHIFALWPAEDGSVYAATGPRGRIYRVFPDGSASMLWDAKAGNVVGMTENDGGLCAVQAGERRVISLDLEGGAQGEFLSAVLDATGPSNWGQIRWQADLPEDASLILETRTGGTGFPDSAWSDWSTPYLDSSGENISSPQARYLQYRATLRSAGPARPALRQVEVFYMTVNRPPQLQLLSPVQAPVWSGKQNIKWSATDPDKDSLTYQVFYSADNGQTWTEIKEPVKKAEEPPAAAASAAENNAADPGEAAILAMLDKAGAAKEGQQTPSAPVKPGAKEKPKAEPPTKATSMSWDTAKVSDGIYLIKVVASDRQSSPRDALSDERISEPFRIDNTPPLIVLDKREANAPPPSKIEAVDAGTYVTGAEYRVDEGEWSGAYCEDGIYDSQREVVLIDSDDLPAGEHLLQVKVRDSVGNEATNEVRYKKP
jgi:sugar lactone lactonase YvrE